MTHSTAIEGSTVTEIENQLLFDEGIAAKGRSLTEQMMKGVRKEDKGEYIQSLVDSRENEDSTIAQDTMLRHHTANLNRCVLQYKVSDGVNEDLYIKNDSVKVENDGVKQLNKTLKRVYEAFVNRPAYQTPKSHNSRLPVPHLHVNCRCFNLRRKETDIPRKTKSYFPDSNKYIIFVI